VQGIGFLRKKVFMRLLIHPDWLKGSSGYNGDRELGGWVGNGIQLRNTPIQLRSYYIFIKNIIS